MATEKASINVYDHGVALDHKKIRVQCNYCGKVVSGSYRLKCHLGGVGKDVVSCPKVAPAVKESFRNMLQEIRNKTLSKQVGKLSHPHLPLKRSNNSSPISKTVEHFKHEATQAAAAAASLNQVQDGFPGHNTRLDPKLAEEDAASKLAKKCIARFFYETGIDFSSANSSSFKTMLNTIPGSDGVKIPTVEELRGWILWDQLKETQEYVNKIKHSWASTGCSILLEEWVNDKGQNLVSFVVECPAGPVYLRSADVSSIINDVSCLQLLLDGVLEQVGIKNVVQVVACSTTGWVGNVGKQFMDRHRTVFWNVSTCHCIKLMLENIVRKHRIKGIIDKAKMFTRFIYGHRELLKLMRNHTHSYDLIKPSKLKFAVPFLTLENIILEEKNLKKMFASPEWSNSGWASSPEGKRVAELMGDVSFWRGADLTMKATVPLIRVLDLLMEADEPQVGFIYEMMDQAKETIQEEMGYKEALYKPLWKAIDEIWNTYLHSPLHAAAYYLNPSLFYSADFYSDNEVFYGLMSCVVRMVQDPDIQNRIVSQIDEYRHARGDFSEGSAIDKRASVPPAHWWCKYGKQQPELQKFAVRILNQTCDGAAKYGLKRSMAEKLLMNGRNRIEQQRLSDLAYVHYNLHFQNREIGAGSEEIDPMDDWIVDKAALETIPRNGGSEWTGADSDRATLNVEQLDEVEAQAQVQTQAQGEQDLI